MAIGDVEQYYVSNEVNAEMKELAAERNIPLERFEGLVFMVKKDSEDYKAEMEGQDPKEDAVALKEYLMDNFTPEERAQLKNPKYFRYYVHWNGESGL